MNSKFKQHSLRLRLFAFTLQYFRIFPGRKNSLLVERGYRRASDNGSQSSGEIVRGLAVASIHQLWLRLQGAVLFLTIPLQLVLAQPKTPPNILWLCGDDHAP